MADGWSDGIGATWLAQAEGVRELSWRAWYDSLAKPVWTPTPTTIGRIWQVLYAIIAVSFGYVFLQLARGRLRMRVVWPFVVNLVANLAFTPLLFGWRNLPVAALDILLVWVTIVWGMIAIWPYYRWVAWAQVPYLIWVSLATVLQLSITWMNAT
jgi:benzodiazapine receptor